jgi:hypothetical protein
MMVKQKGVIIAGLYNRQHVHCYCSKCERWRALDLQRLIAIV